MNYEFFRTFVGCMNQGHKQTISIRIVSCAFIVLALAIFKPFGLEVWQWQAYIHLLGIFALGLFSCFLTEVILKYVVRMPRSYDRGVSYIISRNLRFQCINTPLVSLLICLYRHFAMSSSRGLQIPSNVFSLTNYIETLVIIAFLSFAIGLYWRFKFRSHYLAAELEETRLLNEQLKKFQKEASTDPSHPFPDSPMGGEEGVPKVSPRGDLEGVTLTGATNEHVSLKISDLLYIEAVGNYVKVCQLHDGEVKTNMLRATMKQMEDTLQSYPMIVRCHRAFMVNLGQVDQISSNSRAMQLIMRHSHDAIPVSRSNVSKLKNLLG
ncbi:MAG: LytTR family transcriptional regulator DNA-binding domain-containing protein [Prevotella sp.]|nr:LytTR family transcriptional regulator DNA-binding domain-containing protein [Prevotella sp.]